MIPEISLATNVSDLPLMMTAKDIQRMGLSHDNAYALLHREDMPVLVIGRRRYLKRDEFFGIVGLPETTAAKQQQSSNPSAECQSNAHTCPLMHFFAEIVAEYNLAETRRRGA